MVQKEAFPRGGTLALTPLEYRDVVEEATKDSLLPQPKKRGQNSSNGQSKKQRTEVEEVYQPEQARIETLTFKKLCVGQVLLAAVREITEIDLVMSLPSQLTAYVSITEISACFTTLIESAAADDAMDIPSLSTFFSIGQLVPVVITELTHASDTDGTKRRIELSMNPAYVNKRVTRDALVLGMSLSVSVISEEDHGYVLDAGVKDTQFFFPSKAANGLKLVPGQLVQCTIINIDSEARNIRVQVRGQGCAVKQDTVLTVNALMPGTTVQCQVQSVVERGLTVLVHDLFEASISTLHLDNNTVSSYKPKQKLTATILYADYDSKSFILTLNSNILALTPIAFSLPIGSFLPATIQHQESTIGLLASLPSNHGGYIHISRVSDAPMKRFGDAFALSTVHQSRVVGLDYLDGLYILSLERKVLDALFMRHEDIRVGMLVDATVTKMDDAGVIVLIGENMSALIPNQHLSDITLSNPGKRYRVGVKIKAQILAVDVDRKRIILTCKRSLMHSKHSIIGEYNNDNVDKVASGVVRKIENYGVIVGFYGGVTGICLRSDVGSSSYDWKEDFTLGQVVVCRVLSVDADLRKMRVSMKLKSRQDIEEMVLGSMHEATVVTKESDNVILELTTLGIMAILPKAHLSDFPAFAEKRFKRLIRGTVLQVALVEKDLKNAKAYVTMKPILIQSLAVISQTNLVENVAFPAFINKISDSFLTLKTVTGEKLVVMKKNVSERFTNDIKEVFVVGGTVCASVLKVHDDLRMEATLRGGKKEQLEISYLDSFMAERDALTIDCGLKIGADAKGRVVQVLQSGYILEVDGGWKGLLTMPVPFKATHSIGESVDARILDIDLAKKIVDLVSKPKKTGAKAVKINGEYECVVEIVKEEYLVVSCAGLGGVLGMMAAKMFNTFADSLPAKFSIGQKVTSVLLRASTTDSITLFAYRDTVRPAAPSDPKPSTKLTHALFKNPIDKSIKSLADLTLGSWIQVKVKSRKETQVNVQIADNIHGRIHITQLQPSATPSTSNSLLARFTTGQTLNAQIIGFHDSRTHKYLPISNSNAATTMVEFSTRTTPSASPTYYEDLVVGKQYDGFVQKVDGEVIWVSLSNNVHGRIHAIDASHSAEVPRALAKHYKVGDPLKCVVIKSTPERSLVDLSVKEASGALSVGSVTCGRVISVKDTGVILQIGAGKFGRLHLCDLSDSYDEKRVLEVGSIVSCYILATSEDKYELSLRQSLLSGSSSTSVKDTYIKSINDLVAGQHVRGFVKQTTENGCFVSLSRTITARVKISEMSDGFVEDFRAIFADGQVVSGVVLSVNADQNRVEMSLKATQTSASTTSSPATLTTLVQGSLHPGTIRKVEQYGVFIKLTNSTLSGLCHITQLARDIPGHPSELYEVGDAVMARVLTVELAKRRVNFSLVVEEEQAQEAREIVDKMQEAVVIAEQIQERLQQNVEVEDAMEVDDEESEDEQPAATPMQIDEFTWNDATSAIHTSDSDSDTPQAPQKKSKRVKEFEKKQKERLIEQTELTLLSNTPTFESPQDYERLLLSTPNSSYTWIKYMASQLQLSETQKARDIAERAIAKISYREQQEKLNIWIAYLNLENTYGTPDTLTKTLERALILNDPKKIYMQMVGILERSRKIDECEDVYASLIKKFNQSCKVWCAYALFSIKTGSTESFRAVMKRALLSLPKRKRTIAYSTTNITDVKTIIKFAQMEYKSGDPERARTIFEGVLANYPKRVDLWNVYLDMEIKSNKRENVRRVFDRVIVMRFSSKKLKFLFKKYLDFEKLYGDEDGVERVKQAAQAYVQKMQE